MISMQRNSPPVRDSEIVAICCRACACSEEAKRRRRLSSNRPLRAGNAAEASIASACGCGSSRRRGPQRGGSVRHLTQEAEDRFPSMFAAWLQPASFGLCESRAVARPAAASAATLLLHGVRQRGRSRRSGDASSGSSEEERREVKRCGAAATGRRPLLASVQRVEPRGDGAGWSSGDRQQDAVHTTHERTRAARSLGRLPRTLLHRWPIYKHSIKFISLKIL